MTHKERLRRHLRGEEVDRMPMLGGWILGAHNLAHLAGLDWEGFFADAPQGVVLANRRLQVDGMVPPIVPTRADAIRTGHLTQQDFSQVEPEVLLERANRIPDSEAAVLRGLNRAEIEAHYRQHFTDLRRLLGDIEIIPTIWEATASFSLYFQYGYEAFLSALALYPEALDKIWWEAGLQARVRNEILARLIVELDITPVVFCGEDICNGTGPMCSPAALRRSYWPATRHALEPYLEAGIRLVCHCDGNVMPLVDDFLDAGFSGFQGFQYEFGVDPWQLRAKPTRMGKKCLFFAGLSVSRTLPYGTPEEIRAEVDYCLDYSEGGEGLFLFTSNVTGVEVPPANIAAAYDYLTALDPRTLRRGCPPRPWPWLQAHPGDAVIRR